MAGYLSVWVWWYCNANLSGAGQYNNNRYGKWHYAGAGVSRQYSGIAWRGCFGGGAGAGYPSASPMGK